MANKEISVDDILQKIDHEINRADDLVAQIVDYVEPLFEDKDHYILEELCQFYDEEFIEKAFWAILKRIPDKSCSESYLQILRNGKRSKKCIIALLRYSDEGKEKNITITGGLYRYHLLNLFYNNNTLIKLHCIVCWFETLFNLSSLIKKFNDYELHFQQSIQNELKLQDACKKLERDKFQLSKELSRNNLSIKSIQNNIIDLVEQKNSQWNTSSSTENNQQFEAPISQYQKHFFDLMYIAFEDRFRGSREQIKEQMSVYLPYIMQAIEFSKPVLDIGCGRCELLELLAENKIPASGIDLNTVMISKAQDAGHNVKVYDALAYLKQCPKNSLSAITGIHIIEHLSFEIMIRLLQESIRVLKPKGIIIFETPNPENVFVGAHFFYRDPTHNNPLVPETMAFIFNYIGFQQIEIKRLHPYADAALKIGLELEESCNFKNDHFYNAMDYAIIAYKDS